MKMLYAGLLFASACLWADNDGNGGCGNHTLKGSYGFSIAGTRPAPGGGVEQFIGIALTRFDGQGALTQTGSSHGSITGDTPEENASGTYSLNRDCSGTMTLEVANRPPINLWIVVVDRGREIRTIVGTPVPPTGPVPAAGLTTSNGRKVGPSDD